MAYVSYTYGSVGGSGYNTAKIGLSHNISSTTETAVTVSFRGRLASNSTISDSSNTVYFNVGSSSATTSRGSKSINHTGYNTGYSDSDNQTTLYTSSATTYERKAEDYKVYYACKMSGLDVIGETISHSRYVTIPALESYIITFDGNGGEDVPDSQSKLYGETINLSTEVPVRDGYVFVGWNLTPDSTESFYAPGSIFTKNADITLYAIWKKTISLTFDANGGTNAPEGLSTTVYNDTTSYTFTIPEAEPTRDGHTFLGWGLIDDTEPSFYPGDEAVVSDSYTLYAMWEIHTYTVSYDGNKGTGAPEDQVKTYGIDLILSDVKPRRTAYTFLGWSTSADGEIEYMPGDTYADNAPLTLYAIWRPSGLVYIHNGQSYDAYFVYIDNGSDWDMYIPYLYDGTEWNIMS